MAYTVKPLIELPNGERMPIIGLGTWGMFNDELSTAISTALQVGYRHFDTAFFHGNEETIGSVLNEWIDGGKVTRSDLFVAAKLPPIGMQSDKVKHFCNLSLQNLKLSYLDLYLIQLPVGIKYRSDDELLVYNADGSLAVDCVVELADTWKEMEKLVEEGHVKNIGVCNFKLEQLEKLLSLAVIKPAVLQIELHAYCQQNDLRSFCMENGIVVTGFCPLGSPGRDDMFLNGSKLCLSLMQDPIVGKLAEKCGKTPAQILLRHALQKGIVVVPKSATPSRIKENIEIFNFFFTPNEMKCLNMLDKGQYARSFNYSFFGESEYFEVLDETIRTNPYRKAATAMASVMNKHGIVSNASSVLGKPSLGLPEKKCALTRSLILSQNCNQKLNVTKDDLQALCAELVTAKIDKSPTFNKETTEKNEPEGSTPTDNPTDRAVMTGHLLTLIGEAQTIAKRIYETAVGLHVVEDYLRQPDDLRTLDFSSGGRIQIPNYNFNHASQLCLEWLHSTATKWLRGFKEDGREDSLQFIKVFETFTKAVKDYTEAVCLANQVFRVVLYPNAYGKECLREYVISLGHVLKNDIMMEIQSLRRAFDSIQYSFERLGWAASIAWMKYSGQHITVETLNENGIQVDHSMFQHKFYEGPSKLKKKSKTDTNVNSTNNMAAVKPSTKSSKRELPPKPTTTVTKLLLPRSTRSARSDPGENKQEDLAKKEPSCLSVPTDDTNNLIDTLSIPRVSRSTIEISKTKKLPPRKKGKQTKQGDQKTPIVSQVSSEAAVNPMNDESSARMELLKLLISEKESSASQSQSISPVDSTTNQKIKAIPLTPPPNIPSAWRKQFGAVFGAHLVPPKPQKKAKKKASFTTANNPPKSIKK